MLELMRGRWCHRRRFQAGPAGGSPAALGPWRHRAGLGAAAQDADLKPPGRSVTAPKRARAESPPPTAGPPLNRKPYAGRGGPPPCSAEPAGPWDGSDRKGGDWGGRESRATAAEKLRLCHRSEAPLQKSRSVHIDGPKRKSLG